MEETRRIPTVSGHSSDESLRLRAISDAALLVRLERLVAQERENTAAVIEHLMEIDRRELAIDLSYPSLFLYCVKKLGYSESAAFLRIRAARAAAEFPNVLFRLRRGELHLDAVARLSPYLSESNNQALLEGASGASKREVLAMVAQLQTEPAPERDLIIPVKPPPQPSPSCPNENESVPEIISPPQHRFHFTADEELFLLVERLRELMRHKIPDGRLEGIFKEAARALLERIERDKCPSGPHPPNGKERERTSKSSRLVPKAVKRIVWARDEGRCVYMAIDGRRCESREALEYDHIVPWADGGRSDTPDNIRLLCRAHNQRLGRRRFGPRRRA